MSSYAKIIKILSSKDIGISSDFSNGALNGIPIVKAKTARALNEVNEPNGLDELRISIDNKLDKLGTYFKNLSAIQLHQMLKHELMPIKEEALERIIEQKALSEKIKKFENEIRSTKFAAIIDKFETNKMKKRDETLFSLGELEGMEKDLERFYKDVEKLNINISFVKAKLQKVDDQATNALRAAASPSDTLSPANVEKFEKK